MERFLFKKCEVWCILLLLLVLLPAVGYWGFAFAKYEVFPYSIYTEIKEFVEGDPMGRTTVWDRFRREYDPVATWIVNHDANLSADYKPVSLNEVAPTREKPRVFMSGPQPAYRVLIGVFDMKDSLWGAVLLDREGNVCHEWKLSGSDLRDPEGPEGILYGATITPDGSIIYSKQDLGKGVVKRDRNGTIVWINEGLYHHVVSPDEDFKHVWTFGRGPTVPFPELVKIDSETGRTVKTIAMEDVYKANPHIHIFDHRTKDEITNMPHPNDIEVLSSELASAFPMFKAGDLAINYHMNGLVFVIDPETLKVKFWYTGAGDGAHDVDFQENGLLTIFNNNYRAGWHEGFQEKFSEIVAISPVEHKHWVVVSGKQANLVTRTNGRHQFRDGNCVMFDSALQGRFTELDSETGRVTFDFVNVYNENEGKALLVSESFQFPEGYFTFVDKIGSDEPKASPQ